MALPRRRMDLKRMKNKARKVYNEADPEKAIKWANHLKVCSCSNGCGNPRRTHPGTTNLTRSELKAQMDFKEQINE